MNPHTILYGTRIGEPSWKEDIIFCCPAGKSTDEAIVRAREWAEANGFDRLRVHQWDGSAPDFAGTVVR